MGNEQGNALGFVPPIEKGLKARLKRRIGWLVQRFNRAFSPPEISLTINPGRCPAHYP